MYPPLCQGSENMDRATCYKWHHDRECTFETGHLRDLGRFDLYNNPLEGTDSSPLGTILIPWEKGTSLKALALKGPPTSTRETKLPANELLKHTQTISKPLQTTHIKQPNQTNVSQL